MSYTLELKLFLDKETGELFSKATVGNFKGRDLELIPNSNPYDAAKETVINYQVVEVPSPYDKIVRYKSIIWEGYKDHKVEVKLFENNTICVSASDTSNNAKDAEAELKS